MESYRDQLTIASAHYETYIPEDQDGEVAALDAEIQDVVARRHELEKDLENEIRESEEELAFEESMLEVAHNAHEHGANVVLATVAEISKEIPQIVNDPGYTPSKYWERFPELYDQISVLNGILSTTEELSKEMPHIVKEPGYTPSKDWERFPWLLDQILALRSFVEVTKSHQTEHLEECERFKQAHRDCKAGSKLDQQKIADLEAKLSKTNDALQMSRGIVASLQYQRDSQPQGSNFQTKLGRIEGRLSLMFNRVAHILRKKSNHSAENEELAHKISGWTSDNLVPENDNSTEMNFLRVVEDHFKTALLHSRVVDLMNKWRGAAEALRDRLREVVKNHSGPTDDYETLLNDKTENEKVFFKEDEEAKNLLRLLEAMDVDAEQFKADPRPQ